jgi:hypothetical protein
MAVQSMGMKDWFSRKTALQAAIERGTKPDGDLSAELCALTSYTIASTADATALCDVLERIVTTEPTLGGESALQAVIYRFLDVKGDGPAFPVMLERGTPSLLTFVDDTLEGNSPHDPEVALTALKVLALYCTPEGTDAVLRAAHTPLLPDATSWIYILDAYTEQHPEQERLLETLGEHLPSGILAHALLNNANATHAKGRPRRHPFDSDAGMRQLEQWLAHEDLDEPWFAISAVNSLPFLDHTERDQLVARAMDHADVRVQLEAALTAGRLEREAGVKWLSRACLDLNLAERAMQCLRELGREDAIPSMDDDFQVRSHFAAWLAHPFELGKPPDEVEVYDHRELAWPPDGERKGLWLLQYRMKDASGLKADNVDVGMVGSITFCLFSYGLEQRPPADGYAIHCFFEMREHHKLIVEEEFGGNLSEYNAMLAQYAGEALGPARITLVAEISPRLKYPQRLVALAEAKRNGEPGWLVLDGSRSRWYGASEMPAGNSGRTVLMLHVGRVLLGFTDEPDRRKFLRRPAAGRPAEQTVAAYERLLNRARSSLTDAEELLESGSVLATAMGDYVTALASLRSQPEAVCACEAYESLLATAASARSLPKYNLLEEFSPLARRNFDRYADALIALNRQTDVLKLIESFRRRWDDHRGYATLGAAAFRSGHDRLAEGFLSQLRDTGGNWCQNNEMSFLAEIWHREGRLEEANALLIAAMKGAAELCRKTIDREVRAMHEETFQFFRSTYLRLFAERGEEALRHHGIPTTTA